MQGDLGHSLSPGNPGIRFVFFTFASSRNMFHGHDWTELISRVGHNGVLRKHWLAKMKTVKALASMSKH